ncbi:hypothetical protein CPAR01_07904 [Colletotrichum paranaense]|uniref:Uncharacterized protein n=1 Tax=Colletotrichum paranaense TaxID=1914294 RepID=A0ABQ9SJ21_9PEZI|nr:uncharacterized protein CPAR01_07904 [Colletotrichum paranaense]KAK1537791.1 hypothetical protein CPAR01_07904 [Colletotrichum paranaense]
METDLHPATMPAKPREVRADNRHPQLQQTPLARILLIPPPPKLKWRNPGSHHLEPECTVPEKCIHFYERIDKARCFDVNDMDNPVFDVLREAKQINMVHVRFDGPWFVNEAPLYSLPGTRRARFGEDPIYDAEAFWRQWDVPFLCHWAKARDVARLLGSFRGSGRWRYTSMIGVGIVVETGRNIGMQYRSTLPSRTRNCRMHFLRGRGWDEFAEYRFFRVQVLVRHHYVSHEKESRRGTDYPLSS